MIEKRRRVKRTRVDGSGRILPAGHFRLLPCDLFNLTDKDAGLDIGALADQLGQPFDFSFENFRTIRSARLTWSNGGMARVEFL